MTIDIEVGQLQLDGLQRWLLVTEQTAIEQKLRPVKRLDSRGNRLPPHSTGLDLFQKGDRGVETVRSPGQSQRPDGAPPDSTKASAGSRGPKSGKQQVEVLQLPLFQTTSPVEEALKAMDVNALSPIEALTRLYELQQMLDDQD